MRTIILKYGFRVSAIIIILGYSLTLTLSAQEQALTPAERMKEHVRFLASDELEGRYPGTEGIRKAAEYIKSHFKNCGLLPLGDGYQQEFTVTTGLKLGSGNSVQFDVVVEKPGVPRDMLKPVTRTWKINQDFVPINFSDNASVSGELVFAGYGITAKDLKYDDYEGVDVKGKVVVVLTNSPVAKVTTKYSGSYHGEKNTLRVEYIVDDGDFTPFSGLRYKATNARDHGAVGVIFVNIQGDSADVMPPLGFSTMSRNSGITAVFANRTSLSKLFPRAAQINPIEQEINKTKKPNSFPISNTVAKLTVDLLNDDKPTHNIVGWVKGADSKLSEEYIVVGAHYDHLGWGGSNSLHKGSPEVHNGADDNASGTAMLMELACRFAKTPARRSLVFIAFSAEELGLQGSAYYVNNPLKPLEKKVTMINFDMVGRFKENRVNVFGIGTSPVFETSLDSLALLDSISITKAKDGFAPSDHAAFYGKNMPVMMLFTGVHEDYHKPSDDWDKLNYNGMQSIARYSESIIRFIGNLDEKPPFSKVSEPEGKMGSNRGGYGAWFGIIPNFAENPNGCLISGSTAGSPAHKAGFQDGDVITKFGDKPIKNLHDLTFALNEYKPGDKVLVVYLRGGKEHKTEVTLSRRN